MKKLLLVFGALVLALGGVLAWTWSLFCFAGGPDGRIGSRGSILYGSGFMLLSVLCCGVFFLLNGKKRRALITLGILYDVVAALFALLFTVVFFAMHLEHDDWIFSLLIAALLLWSISIAGVYGLFRLVKKTETSKSERKEGGK